MVKMVLNMFDRHKNCYKLLDLFPWILIVIEENKRFEIRFDL